MQRVVSPSLQTWLDGPDRMPLVLRGARQVGKTWLVRELARSSTRQLVEINFERDPRLARVFSPWEPGRVLSDLGLHFQTRIDPRTHLLFLDEIQAAPKVLASLRWFREEIADLPVIAAGSLLEFALVESDLSVPVGRLTYRHLEPMNFEEYLLAHRQEPLLERLHAWQPGRELSPTEHERAQDWYARFAHVGGMPAVVKADASGATAAECRVLQTDLMATFRDDFARYASRMDSSILDSVLLATARQLGNKFVYARIGEGVKQYQAKEALERLAMARMVTLACHTAANGIPLEGEREERHRKASLLDVGLLHALLRTPAGSAFPHLSEMAPSVRGQLAEQLAAQQLRCIAPASGTEPTLHYWQRSGGRAGEIDFLVQIATRIVPVELKAGAAGSMKSLHQFMHDKQMSLAVRVDTNLPSLMNVDVKTTQGDPSRYALLGIPGYLLFRLRELIESLP
jgi:predicted AAA+ superfamily ATPase